MKLVFTGAGGGHFYPLIAVAEEIRKQVFVQKINTPSMYFLSDAPYDERALFDNGIKFIPIPSGKMHVFFSLEIFINIFKMFFGIIVAFREMYRLYPDVVFAKGGYSSFPVLFAARLLSIPVIIHESDAVAGRVTSWAGKFAVRVALSQKEAGVFFKNKNIALTGQPIRASLLPPENFSRKQPTGRRPVILIIGGSQGSLRINEVILSGIAEILNLYDVIHQTGVMHIDGVKEISKKLLENHPHKERYYAEGFLDPAIFYPKVDLVITRAGSTSLFETAMWRLPQIVIPIPEDISRDQKSNAYSFARFGSATVIEENNLSPHVLLSELSRILDNKELFENMSQAGANADYSRGAAEKIATEMLRIGLSHSV